MIASLLASGGQLGFTHTATEGTGFCFSYPWGKLITGCIQYDGILYCREEALIYAFEKNYPSYELKSNRLELKNTLVVCPEERIHETFPYDVNVPHTNQRLFPDTFNVLVLA